MADILNGTGSPRRDEHNIVISSLDAMSSYETSRLRSWQVAYGYTAALIVLPLLILDPSLLQLTDVNFGLYSTKSFAAVSS
jgi:hypothetical protein